MSKNGTYTTRTNVTLRILPYNMRLYRRLEQAALEKHPVPKDKKKRKEAEEQRNWFLGEGLLDFLLAFCIDMDLSEWEPAIRRLEKYTEPYPDDPIERRVRFLTDYAISTPGEYTEILTRSLKLAMGAK